MTDTHEGFTRMLFVDAIVGVGFQHHKVSECAAAMGLAEQGVERDDWYNYVWNRPALEALPLPTLQDLYTSLKLHEVTHVG